MAWDKGDSLPTETGNYYLTTDVELTSRWTVNVNISLCLNGHTITVNNSKAAGGIADGILVERATLNLTACKGTGKITSLYPTTPGKKVVVVACWTDSELNMYGGTITGVNVGDNNGGGVHNEGIFNMYGGSITGNTAGTGGGVYNWTNTGKSEAITATFNFYGGSISGNTATDDTTSSEVYFNGGTVNIAGGTINGKIKVNGTNTITGVIQGNVEISGLGDNVEKAYYTVTFNSNGGSTVASQTLIGANAKAVKPADPTKEGYTFVGWVNEDGSDYSFDAAVTRSLTLTAVWEEIPAPEGHTHIRRQPAATTTADTTVSDTTKADTVTSAKTFDVGSTVYGVMAVAALLGVGYVGKKRG